jgi:outer membrane protein OmpA-like peptidoglycan-associated protein
MAKEVQITALETEEQRNAVILKATFTGSSITKEGRLPPTRDKTFAAPTKTVSFKLWIVMEGATLGPRPGPYRLHPHTIYYDEGRYLLNAPQVVALADFLKSYPGAYDSLRDSDAADDQGRVKITAFASPKGRPQDNLDLADNRAREVRKRLEQLGVRHANIADPFTPGELGGKGTGEPAGNDAIRSEQRVEIVLPERRVDE